MSSVSIESQASSKNAAIKEKASLGFVDLLAQLRRTFWNYTEETAEGSTKSFEGIL